MTDYMQKIQNLWNNTNDYFSNEQTDRPDSSNDYDMIIERDVPRQKTMGLKVNQSYKKNLISNETTNLSGY